MLPSAALCALVLAYPPKLLSDRERAAVAVLRLETQAERRRQLNRKAVVSYGGEALSDAEWNSVRTAMQDGRSHRPSAFPVRNLIFRRVDGLGKRRYRVGVMPQIHPPGPPTYTTYVVALGTLGDKIVSAVTGRVMAQTSP